MANCQAGMFLAYVSPLGRALVNKRLHLPESWTSDWERCAAAGVPPERSGYKSRTELALGLLRRARSEATWEPSGLPRTMPSAYRHLFGTGFRP